MLSLKCGEKMKSRSPAEHFLLPIEINQKGVTSTQFSPSPWATDLEYRAQQNGQRKSPIASLEILPCRRRCLQSQPQTGCMSPTPSAPSGPSAGPPLGTAPGMSASSHAGPPMLHCSRPHTPVRATGDLHSLLMSLTRGLCVPNWYQPISQCLACRTVGAEHLLHGKSVVVRNHRRS